MMQNILFHHLKHYFAIYRQKLQIGRSKIFFFLLLNLQIYDHLLIICLFLMLLF